MSTPLEGPDQGGLATLDRELEELIREENIEPGDHERFSHYVKKDKILESAITGKPVRALCGKYSAICGFHIHPHLYWHTMAHQFLEDNPGELISLAQLLGHTNIQTTSRYVQRTQQQLGEAAERINF